jgi:4-alpha-glucanotransferase
MQKTTLLLGLHCHQPVDNFSYVVDKAIAVSYRPFFEIVSRYPSFKFSLHISGWLFEYIKIHDAGLFVLMQKCHTQGQVEFFTGGFYEPILASIRSKDRVAQIKKLNDFLYDNFGAKPKGLWLTERVWENSILSDVCDLGIEYVTVDDYHFISAGFDKHTLNGYYTSEESGKRLKIFPINKTLRYLLPFHKPNKVLEAIRQIKGENSAAVIFDDGEKFGLWPKTYEWVYEKKWLEEFLDLFCADSELTTATYEEFAASNKSLGLAYLPSVSYCEMGEWSLRAHDTQALEHIRGEVSYAHGEDSADKFVKGGIWKNFLVKYTESNRIHKRVLDLAMNAKKVKSKEFYESLYKAQTNDALWHGVFGGLYLGNLRDNAYKYITECENIYKSELPNEKVAVGDINLDGHDEVRFLADNFTLMFESKNGGQLSEFCLRDKLFNIQNTLTRRREAYHAKVINPPVYTPACDIDECIESIHSLDISRFEYLKEHIAYDWYDKNSFIDHITDDDFGLENFRKCSFKECGDFANQPFEVVSYADDMVKFERNGGIYGELDERHETKVEKSYSINKSGIRFDIRLSSKSDDEHFYVCEFNLHFADATKIKINDLSLGDGLTLEPIHVVTIEDPELNKTITFRLDNDARVFIYPVNTISQNEEGFELSNQGVTFGFIVPFVKNLDFAGRLDVTF